MARVLAELGGELARRSLGHHVGEAAGPALGLRDDLVGDHQHVAGAWRAGRRARRRSAPARSSPGWTSGRPSSAVAAISGWLRPAAHQLVQHAAGVGRAAVGVARAGPAAPRGPRACRRRAPAMAPRPPRPRGSPPAARRLVALAAVGAEAEAQARPAASAAARSSPYRGGRGRSAPSAAARPACEEARRARRGRARAVAGHQQDAVRARLERGVDARAWPQGCGRGRGRRRHRRRSPPAICCATWSAVTTMTPSTVVARRSATSTSENIASASARRSPGLRSCRRRRFACSKVLIGRIASVGMIAPTLPAARA